MSVARLALALHAVSTSPVMPGFGDYMREVEALRETQRRTNPRAPFLELAMHDHGRPLEALGDVKASDFLTALTSFTDDYNVTPPKHLFEVPAAMQLLDGFAKSEDLVVTEQLRLALELLDGALFRSVMALHTAIRVLARGRDTRLAPTFAMSLDERMQHGRAIAPFHPEDSRGGDPLGDTYHFWANVAAGLFGVSAEQSNSSRGLVRGMLYAGPWLMRTVREGMFSRTLFYGDHARIDRLGLRIGRRLGRRGAG